MHFIAACLARCDIAIGEKRGGRKVRRWRPSRRLEGCFGVKRHGIPDELERIEAPIAISTLADELSELLQASGETIDEVAFPWGPDRGHRSGRTLPVPISGP
jgi:hypothetical protein